MARRYFTKNELLRIYRDAMQDIEPEETAKALGSTKTSIQQAIRTLVAFLKGERTLSPFGTPKAYREALAIIRVEANRAPSAEPQVQEEVPVTEDAVKGTGLQRLESAFTSLQEAIGDVIVEEVQRRTKETVKKKEDELEVQREAYEQKLLKMQAIITEMKDSSILGVIQKKWKTL